MRLLIDKLMEDITLKFLGVLLVLAQILSVVISYLINTRWGANKKIEDRANDITELTRRFDDFVVEFKDYRTRRDADMKEFRDGLFGQGGLLVGLTRVNVRLDAFEEKLDTHVSNEKIHNGKK